jgi:argininosuccinate lyase
MEHTGRIAEPPHPLVRRLLFEDRLSDELEHDLPFMCQIDRAHVVMLAGCGIVGRQAAAEMLDTIDKLEAQAFAPLRGRPAPRGLYLLYEDYLIERTGTQAGGMLHAGRSRNDLGATALCLRLRAPFADLLKAALGLEATLLGRARRCARVPMPLYTHFQAALPVTLGHYLVGTAVALDRDVEGLLAAGAGLRRCPLGAAAGGGTTLPIDPRRTARLLGFDEPVHNSIDAVASRDTVLRLLAAAAVLGVTLSRLATDLLLWSSREFGFLHLPDEAVGSSSAMPQKRNPFVLEHVQGRGSTPVGGFVAAASAMRSTPFTNSIAAGREAVEHVWKALADTTTAARLARFVVARARPVEREMQGRAEAGNVTATAMAEALVADAHVPFRTAHRVVGELVRSANGDAAAVECEVVRLLREHGVDASPSAFAPEEVVARARGLGGPAAGPAAAAFDTARARWASRIAETRAFARRWAEGRRELADAVEELTA